MWTAYDLGTNAPTVLPPGKAFFKKRVAIKVLVHAEGAALEYFKAEALIMSRLPEDTICQVFDYFTEAGRFYIVMEYLDGVDCQTLVETKPLRPTVQTVVYIGIQVLQGLDFMYRAGGIIHRDLTPHNVLCTLGGQVKIVDFGVAKTRMELRPETKISGAMFGKYHWCAPEMYDTKLDPDHRLDQWNAGLILYELFAGEQAYAGTSAQAMHAICYGALDPIRQRNPLVPAPVSDVIMRMMERDRDQRYATAADAKRALLTAAPSDWLLGREDLMKLVGLTRPSDHGTTDFPVYVAPARVAAPAPAAPAPVAAPIVVAPPLARDPAAPLAAADAITQPPPQAKAATPKLEDYVEPRPRARTAVQMPPVAVAARVVNGGSSSKIEVGDGIPRYIDDDYVRPSLPPQRRFPWAFAVGGLALLGLGVGTFAYEYRGHSAQAAPAPVAAQTAPAPQPTHPATIPVVAVADEQPAKATPAKSPISAATVMPAAPAAAAPQQGEAKRQSVVALHRRRRGRSGQIEVGAVFG